MMPLPMRIHSDDRDLWINPRAAVLGLSTTGVSVWLAPFSFAFRLIEDEVSWMENHLVQVH